MARVHMGVVGYGYWGSKHVRVLHSVTGVRVTVIDNCRARLDEAEAAFPDLRLAWDLADVVDELDGVIVATPPASHTPLALRALEANKHTLVEKPLATSVADAELLVDAARRNGVHLMVGHTFEYNAAVRRLKQIVRSGTLGQVLYIDSARLGLGRYQNDINVIWDLAPNDISIASYLLDEMPAAVSVWQQCNVGVHADVAYLRFNFERSGVAVFVHVSWLDPQKVRRVTVVGSRKMAVYNDLSDNERIRIYDIGVDPTKIDGPGATHAMPVTYRTGDILSPHVPFAEPLVVQDQHFVDCMRTGHTPDTPGERGLEIVRVLAATDLATLDTRPADLNEQARGIDGRGRGSLAQRVAL